MKNLFVLSLLLMCLVTKNYAQDVITPAAAKETATSNLINSVITIDDKTIDYRILKHYTETELRNMPTIKLNQVYFLYTSSYSIKNKLACSSVTMKDVDVAKIEIFRKDNIASIVNYYVGDCMIQVELMPLNILQQKLQEIK
jgi:hypothetical protein